MAVSLSYLCVVLNGTLSLGSWRCCFAALVIQSCPARLVLLRMEDPRSHAKTGLHRESICIQVNGGSFSFPVQACCGDMWNGGIVGVHVPQLDL